MKSFTIGVQLVTQPQSMSQKKYFGCNEVTPRTFFFSKIYFRLDSLVGTFDEPLLWEVVRPTGVARTTVNCSVLFTMDHTFADVVLTSAGCGSTLRDRRPTSLLGGPRVSTILTNTHIWRLQLRLLGECVYPGGAVHCVPWSLPTADFRWRGPWSQLLRAGR